MEKLYRVEELCTNGWQPVLPTDVKLTKPQASARLNELLAEGYNPNRLRAVPDTTQSAN